MCFEQSITIELWIGQGYKENIEKIAKFINSNDIEFFRTMQDDDFLLEQAELFAKIDGAKFIDNKALIIETQFGITDIENISTGLKTALNVMHKIQKFPDEKFCINLDECGNEVLSIIFEMHRGSNVIFYLSRSFFIKDFSIHYDKYIINGKRPKSRDELKAIMQSKEMI
jgi:hypothetical protein